MLTDSDWVNEITSGNKCPYAGVLEQFSLKTAPKLVARNSSSRWEPEFFDNLTDFPKFQLFVRNFSRMHSKGFGVNEKVVALVVAVPLVFTVCETDHLDSSGGRFFEIGKICTKF